MTHGMVLEVLLRHMTHVMIRATALMPWLMLGATAHGTTLGVTLGMVVMVVQRHVNMPCCMPRHPPLPCLALMPSATTPS